MKCKILFVGFGWRSGIYRRAIENLPDTFEVCGILMHSSKRAEELELETGFRATSDFNTALSWKPDFVILCVPKPATKDWLIRFMEHQIPVLCETPPAITVDDLNEIWQKSVELNGKVQVAEQYFLQPYYAAVKRIIDSGLLGDISNVTLSAIHGYHAISIFRHFLEIGFENCTITGKRYHFPVTKTRDRAGWHKTGEILDASRVRADLIFENGKAAFFDFDQEHYFSPIRSRKWNIQGVRGEIVNDVICHMDEHNRPVRDRMHREDDGVNNIDGWSHLYISLHGKRIYENPFPGLRINDDEIAVTDLLVRMKKYIETGEEVYSLRDGLQDAYLDLMLQKATETGESINTSNQSWV